MELGRGFVVGHGRAPVLSRRTPLDQLISVETRVAANNLAQKRTELLDINTQALIFLGS